jgi:hypothetical protein
VRRQRRHHRRCQQVTILPAANPTTSEFTATTPTL